MSAALRASSASSATASPARSPTKRKNGVQQAARVVGGEHRHHPGQRLGVGHVHSDHTSVGERRAADGHVQGAGAAQISSEGRFAGGAPEGHSSLREAAPSTAFTGLA